MALVILLDKWVLLTHRILDSERSDECIDFTMCVFFLCLCTRESVEITLQFQTMGVVFFSKMNLVGALGSFQKRREKPKKKIKEKREFLRKTSFRPNRFFYMNLNFQKFLTFFDVDKKFLDDQKFKFFTKSVENAKICKYKS
ncbi:Uncharacterized protein FWK35_00004780 [Aphis craccivora]|uniref:Uncharacterized protein n=1 Tax=Aphis craccivora TaxID=307492 RepID=A0A6G0Z4V4_APHCR|nr:Uncharacterized protein FWK35_00004780 [Aphis craccivora]